MKLEGSARTWVIVISVGMFVGILGGVIFGPYVSATVNLVLALVIGVALAVGGIQGSPNAKRPQLVPAVFLVVMVSLVVYDFASLYHTMSSNDPNAFVDPTAAEGQPLGFSDALYFSLTVLTTTGFGDVQAASDGARRLVSAEMATALLLVGLFVGRLHAAFGSNR